MSTMKKYMQEIYDVLKDDLKKLDKLKNEIFEREAQQAGSLLEGMKLPLSGKKLRAMLLFLSVKATGGDIKPLQRKLALIVEALHLATLIHDDILDEALIRRLDGTFNTKWGNERAVIFGDFIFSTTFFLCTTLASNYITRIIVESAKVICLGELLQMNERFNFQMTTDRYLKIINYKTAKLFATSCELGTLFAHKKTQKIFSDFGKNFGLMYQILDDLIDIYGDDKIGKSLGTDLEKGKITLPMILLLKKATKKEKENVQRIFSDDGKRDYHLIYEKFMKYKISDLTLDYAKMFCQRAINCLDKAPDNVYKKLLISLAKGIFEEYSSIVSKNSSSINKAIK